MMTYMHTQLDTHTHTHTRNGICSQMHKDPMKTCIARAHTHTHTHTHIPNEGSPEQWEKSDTHTHVAHSFTVL